MEKRACKRVKSDISLRFFCGDSIHSLYYGTLTDLSERGMHISTGSCFPSETKIELIICMRDDILHIPAKVCRVARKDNYYNAMGLEVLSESSSYTDFLASIQITDG